MKAAIWQKRALGASSSLHSAFRPQTELTNGNNDLQCAVTVAKGPLNVARRFISISKFEWSIEVIVYSMSICQHALLHFVWTSFVVTTSSVVTLDILNRGPIMTILDYDDMLER